jgi:hypothetical protein
MERDTAITLVRVFSVLLWIAGILSIIGALGALFGGSGILAGLIPTTLEQSLLGGAAIALGIFLLVLGIFYIATAIGLWRMRSWARIAVIVLSIISLLNFPIGTIIGVIGIILFGFMPAIRALFARGADTYIRTSPAATRRFR